MVVVVRVRGRDLIFLSLWWNIQPIGKWGIDRVSILLDLDLFLILLLINLLLICLMIRIGRMSRLQRIVIMVLIMVQLKVMQNYWRYLCRLMIWRVCNNFIVQQRVIYWDWMMRFLWILGVVVLQWIGSCLR